MLANNSIITFSNAICCRCWENECVVYQSQSGQTHLIEGLGLEIFKILMIRPCSKQQLMEHLDDAFEWPSGFDLEARLDELLSGYQALSLLDVTQHKIA